MVKPISLGGLSLLAFRNTVETSAVQDPLCLFFVIMLQLCIENTAYELKSPVTSVIRLMKWLFLPPWALVVFSAFLEDWKLLEVQDMRMRCSGWKGTVWVRGYILCVYVCARKIMGTERESGGRVPPSGPWFTKWTSSGWVIKVIQKSQAISSFLVTTVQLLTSPWSLEHHYIPE